MPFVKIWIHAVWTTKNKAPWLTHDVRVLLFEHMRNHATDAGYNVDFINGVCDHVHCLISLNANQSLSAALKVIKGESSYWINENHLIEERFCWQNEFYAASVGSVQLKNVRDYIKNQEAHHKAMNFDTEINEFRMNHNFKNQSYVF
jgi:REP element-mobilizing transposase RayT